MVSIRSIIVGALFPAVLVAQQSPSDREPNNIRASFAYFAEHYGRLLVAALDSIPATKYGFSPTPAQQTVGYIAQHLEDANLGLCSALGRPDPRAAAEWRISDSVRAKWPKDTLVARLRASIVFCTAAIAQLNDTRLGEVATTAIRFRQNDLAGARAACFHDGPSRTLRAARLVHAPTRPRAAIICSAAQSSRCHRPARQHALRVRRQVQLVPGLRGSRRDARRARTRRRLVSHAQRTAGSATMA